MAMRMLMWRVLNTTLQLLYLQERESVPIVQEAACPRPGLDW